ncbi:serine hydrolase domain-containing protein [Agromyces cerinus]|uniref:CubicO group peptidase, beta-lactamase class C family n=1 Tax=Agromyces cerinus subsp. cerinus TaxID=232089 RepID=A0A1N6DKY9_9MICO|nr:serine hydrolase domain-containing protein [Agromyces cerinus]SIN71406.1 CubicO group peptidase, beta-lactamase class C family [Agromyces cerinus subsp. cerinus]
MTVATDTLQAVEAVFAERIEAATALGGSWALFDRDGVVASGGAGIASLDPARPAPGPDTLFRIASCTKSFTAAALLLLRDRGLLDLDATARSFVPEFVPEIPGDLEVDPTVRMLMTMSGGLPTDDPWADREESMTREEFSATLAAGIRCASVPGTGFEYSNLGYAVLGQIIERVSGVAFTDFVTHEFIEPLGLDMRFELSAEEAVPYATGHRRVEGNGWLALPFTGPGVFSAIGGLFASVTSLAAWGSWLAEASTGAERGPLSAASRREMQQLMRVAPKRHTPPALPGAPTPPSPVVYGYGFGLFVEFDDRFGAIVSHSGGYPGFSAHMRWHAASGLGVVAFENATYARVSQGAELALAIVLDAADRVAPVSPSPAPWPATLEASVALSGLVNDWSDVAASAVLATNVGLDVPYDERRATIEAAWAAVGGRTAASRTPVDAECDSPDHLVWFLPGATGRLRVEVRMTPLAEPLAQTFLVKVESPEPSVA